MQAIMNFNALINQISLAAKIVPEIVSVQKGQCQDHEGLTHIDIQVQVQIFAKSPGKIGLQSCKIKILPP
jgi:hypothetical protein